MKIVVNRCFGGFNLSHKAVLAYCELKNIEVWPEKDDFFWNYWIVPAENRVVQKSNDEFYAMPRAERAAYNKAYNKAYSNQTFHYRDIARTDLALVQVVETLGKLASGYCSNLQIVEIPDDVSWHITDYDGMEGVAENHRVWP